MGATFPYKCLPSVGCLATKSERREGKPSSDNPRCLSARGEDATNARFVLLTEKYQDLHAERITKAETTCGALKASLDASSLQIRDLHHKVESLAMDLRRADAAQKGVLKALTATKQSLKRLSRQHYAALRHQHETTEFFSWRLETLQQDSTSRARCAAKNAWRGEAKKWKKKMVTKQESGDASPTERAEEILDIQTDCSASVASSSLHGWEWG